MSNSFIKYQIHWDTLLLRNDFDMSTKMPWKDISLKLCSEMQNKRKSGMLVYDIVGLRHWKLYFLLSIFGFRNSKLKEYELMFPYKELALLLFRVAVKDLSFEMELICSSKTKNKFESVIQKDVQKTFNSQKENDNTKLLVKTKSNHSVYISVCQQSFTYFFTLGSSLIYL